MPLLRWSAILVLCVSSFLGRAQQFEFVAYSVNDGLAGSQVKSIYQDRLGYLWIGTVSGVSRFDGLKFENLYKTDGLISAQVNTISELRDSTIVLGGKGGFSKIVGKQISNTPLPEEISSASVNVFFEGENFLWVGTSDGLLQYDQAGFVGLFAEKNGNLVGRKVKSIFECDGQIFVATAKGGLQRLVNNKFEMLTAEKDFLVSHAIPMGDSILVSSSKNGIFKMSSRAPIAIKKVGVKLASQIVRNLYQSKKSGFWTTSRLGATKVYPDGRSKIYNRQAGMPLQDVNELFEDFEGNIWFGTNGSGLLKIRSEAFSVYNEAQGLSSDLIMSVVQTPDSAFWFSSFNKGVMRFDGETVRDFNWENGLQDDKVWSSLVDSKGELWFGTASGLSHWKDGSFVNFTTKDGLSSGKITAIAETKDGKLWLGTASGVTIKSGANFTAHNHRTDFVKAKVRDFCMESNRIWIATSRGLHYFENETFSKTPTFEGLPASTSINSLALDNLDFLWLGTVSGLFRSTVPVIGQIAESVQFERVPLGVKKQNWPVVFLHLSQEDILIGSSRGVFRKAVVAYDIVESKTLRYTTQDGIPSLEANLNSVYEDKGGDIWFGTARGLVRLDPLLEKELEIKTPPKVNISEILIDLIPADWDELAGAGAQSPKEIPSDFTLKYHQNNLTFEYSGKSFADPNELQYQYRMVGQKEVWSPWLKSNFTTFTNLPFTDLRFEVKCKNKFGVESAVALLSFNIQPPFWLTWWFVTLCLLLAFGIAYFVFKARRNNLIMRLEKEKVEIKSKLQSLEQQTLNSSMNRHFIFNALNSIQYYINRQDRLSANLYLSKFAKLIRKNLDSSQTNFTPLSEEIERLELYLNLEHMRFKDKFEYEINVSERIDADSLQVPAMLLQPFLENSIWHGILPKEQKGTIHVDIELDTPEKISFRIKDNGIGIDTSIKKKEESASHISKGMAITNSRIDLIRQMTSKNIFLEGPYELKGGESEVLGTEVVITMPVDLSNAPIY